jgi:GTP-binding protein
MLPVLALVGRPNVGKSTLFNVLTRTRDALVADLPGLTRDRKYGYGRIGNKPFIVVDTGGLVAEAEGVKELMARQTLRAMEDADRILFMVDAREGCTPSDMFVAQLLRKLGKTIVLVLNKAEGLESASAGADFYQLGFGDPQAISSAHGQGVDALIDRSTGLPSRMPSKPDPATRSRWP